jgi:hypothetical protein
MSHSRANSGSFANLLAITRHDEYFLVGGDLFVMVDHVQFRIHRYFFDRESPYFRRLLATPATPGAQRPGTSESTSLVLDDLKPSEFARFLWVFYNPKFSIYNASVDEWATILRLAHRWTFHEVKDLAVRELQKLDSPTIDRIVLYHACEVDRNLLLPQYAALCQREQPLELDEGKRLGLETTLMIATAREYARGCVLPSGGRSPIAANLALSEMVSLIRELFKIAPPPDELLHVTNTIPVTGTTTTATAAKTTSTMTNGMATTTSTTNDSVSTTTNGSAAGSGSGSGSGALNGSATSPTPKGSTTGSKTANGKGASAAENGQTAAAAMPPSNGNSSNNAKPGAGQPSTPVAGRPAPAPPVSNTNVTSPPPEAPPKPPAKGDTSTNDTETAGAGDSTTSPQTNGVQRTGSNSTDSEVDVEADVESVEDEIKTGPGSSKKSKKDKKVKANAAQNGTATPDLSTPRNTPSPINTGNLLDLGGDQNGSTPTPPRGKKGGWLNSSVVKKLV